MSPAAAPPSADVQRFPAADLERRLSAFAVDRLLAWGIAAGVAAAVWRLGGTSVGAAILVLIGVAVLLGLVVAVLLGTTGITPAKALMGLRVVRQSDGMPIGVVPAAGRIVVLGLAGLPTLGLGAATLGWTAAMDPSRRRRGLHDRIGDAVVVDVRPRREDEEVAEEQPQQLVNLTAMRLLPSPQPVRGSQTGARPAVPVPPAPVAAPAVPAVPAPVPPAAAAFAPPPAAQDAGRAMSVDTVPPPAAAPAVAHPAQRPRPPAPTPPATPRTPPGSSGGSPRAEPPAVRSSHPATNPGAGAGGGVARWQVAFDTGEAFEVVGLAIVGRRPEPRAGEPVRHVLSLPSSDMSLSKTHAQFQVAPDGALVVMDRGSTNGSYVVRRGLSRPLTAGRPSTLLDGDVVRFGDRTMTVTRL